MSLLSRKRETSKGVLCHTCFSAWNRDTITEYVRKYLSKKDNPALTRIDNFYLHFLRQKRGESLDSLRDKIGTYLRTLESSSKSGMSSSEIDKLLSQREIAEWGLEFLGELESLVKVLQMKGVEANHLEIASLLSNLARERLRDAYSHVTELAHKLIKMKLRKDVTKASVIREYFKLALAGHDPFEVSQLLDRFGLPHREEELDELIDKVEEELELEEFERRLTAPATTKIGDFAGLDGHEFEDYLRRVFESFGYIVVKTALSRDQGADLIASKEGKRTVIQAKIHKGRVSNKAVQEVVAARGHYGADQAIAVTNSSFTKSAIELAQSNDVALWDGDKLRQVVREVESRGEEPIVTEEVANEAAKRLESAGMNYREAKELVFGMAEELEEWGMDPSYGREFIQLLVRTFSDAQPRSDQIAVGMTEGQEVYPINLSCVGCGKTFTLEVDVTKEVELAVECPHCGWGLKFDETSRAIECKYCSQVFRSLAEVKKHESDCEIRRQK